MKLCFVKQVWVLPDRSDFSLELWKSFAPSSLPCIVVWGCKLASLPQSFCSCLSRSLLFPLSYLSCLPPLKCVLLRIQGTDYGDAVWGGLVTLKRRLMCCRRSGGEPDRDPPTQAEIQATWISLRDRDFFGTQLLISAD